MKNVVILCLHAMVILLADRAVRLENQRYAMLFGMCRDAPSFPGGLWNFDCLGKVETRANWATHLYYVLTDPAPPGLRFPPGLQHPPAKLPTAPGGSAPGS